METPQRQATRQSRHSLKESMSMHFRDVMCRCVSPGFAPEMPISRTDAGPLSAPFFNAKVCA